VRKSRAAADKNIDMKNAPDIATIDLSSISHSAAESRGRVLPSLTFYVLRLRPPVRIRGQSRSIALNRGY
jgi:hypothetical protein